MKVYNKTVTDWLLKQQQLVWYSNECVALSLWLRANRFVLGTNKNAVVLKPSQLYNAASGNILVPGSNIPVTHVALNPIEYRVNEYCWQSYFKTQEWWVILHVQVLLVIRLGCESCSFIMNDQFYGKIILPKFFSHFISISHFMTVCFDFIILLVLRFLLSFYHPNHGPRCYK